MFNIKIFKEQVSMSWILFISHGSHGGEKWNIWMKMGGNLFFQKLKNSLLDNPCWGVEIASSDIIIQKQCSTWSEALQLIPYLFLTSVFSISLNLFLLEYTCFMIFISLCCTPKWVSCKFSSVQLLSRVQLFATPLNHSTPGLLVHHQLPEFTQTHVHWVSNSSYM